MRIKSRWNKSAKEQTLEDIAKALGFISWQIATHSVLELENKGYQTQSQAHRLQIAGEFLAFLLQVADRLAYEQMAPEQRQRFIPALAQQIVAIYTDNQREVLGEGDHRQQTINWLNQRAEDYSECHFCDGEAGFDFLRYFGEQVAAIMAEKHFVSQEITEIQAPEAIRMLKKSMSDLFH